MSTFLQLPRELRDLIYEHYFRSEGGFVYDFAANKIRRADGCPIELSLVLACRQVAAEAHGLALQINPLKFTTFHSEATQEHASLLHTVSQELYSRMESLLISLAPVLLSQEQAQTAKSLYPQFAPVVDYWQSHGEIRFGFRLSRACGEVPSIWRDFVEFALNAISQQPGFIDEAKAEHPLRHSYRDEEAFALNKAWPRPWQIVDDSELARQQEVTGPVEPYWSNTKYTYSAASVALRFLDFICPLMLDNIRKIVLVEDRESISSPESHGRGFIGICQEHPQLKVERFVGLWGNGFPVCENRLDLYLDGDQYYIDEGIMPHDRCEARFISKAVGTWIIEAAALPSLGMPDGSFTLVLDGDPLPEQTSRVFKVIQRDAAWQTALSICYARGTLPQPSWLDQRLHTAGFIHEGFPEAVATISMNSPLIRTNFPVCEPCDVEQLLREHEGWTSEQWEAEWASHEPRRFQTKAPLPPWHLLRWQRVIR